MGGQALVLGGGGVAEHGQDLTGADLIVGTSAGAAVAAQVTSGLSLAELFARQADPARQAPEIPADVDLEEFAAKFGGAVTGATTPAEVRQAVGRPAPAADTVPEADRRAVSPGWARGCGDRTGHPGRAGTGGDRAEPLDPSTRTPAAEAGRAQGAARH
ncbi:hypothetical protein ABJI51_25975 [Amycolatopsis sp. NEAU-NG30]|uniref:PNPLA domain-containing protein n=1 Tax=Amycolatopsis melonis TaxID=3156488 RepID=A0ABV0LJ70_9PSEU